MPYSIENILLRLGPNLSSVIKKDLVSKGLSLPAANQRVSRAVGNVLRLNGLHFPDRQKFLYLKEQFGSDAYFQHLSLALEQTGSAYGRALTALKARGGAMLDKYFPISSGLPIYLAQKQLMHNTVEDVLLSKRLIRKTTTPGGEIIGLWNCDDLSARQYAILKVEDILLSSIKTWLVKMGWSSTNVLNIRTDSKLPVYGQYAWDLAGPCYLASVRRGKTKEGKPMPGCIAGDILLDKTVTTDDIRFFFNKWNSLASQRRLARFQPIIIADSFSQEALEVLRKKGTLIATPSTIFGEDIAKSLRELINHIENAAAAIVKNPHDVFNLISKISKVEGAAGNLRGVLIEMIIAHIHRRNGYYIDIRKKIKNERAEPAEIDVRAYDKREVICCECKGKSPTNLVGVEEIQNWMEKAMPRISSWMRHSESIAEKKSFEFYSSTNYTSEALEFIQKITAAYKQVPIRFFCGNDIIKKLSEMRETELVEIYREQFCI